MQPGGPMQCYHKEKKRSSKGIQTFFNLSLKAKRPLKGERSFSKKQV
jgi:hypothetical protein